ncbi:hypothetical protein GCM10028827_24890 [Mucilaginibacter myungsuensis]
MLRNELFNEENFCKLAAAEKIKNPRPSFSLGRAQLAFWTVIIISSFIYLFLKNSGVIGAGPFVGFKIPKLDAVNLGLLGIAVGTTLISKTIDNGQKDTQGQAVPQQDYPSAGFLTDIISDEKGVSIHRLQNVIWTVVVGGIYISYVGLQDTIALPDDKIITTELLSLMGLSTGAYLGLKLNENKNAPVNAATTNENPEFAPPPPPQAPTANLAPAGDGNAQAGAALPVNHQPTDAATQTEEPLTPPPAPAAPGDNPAPVSDDDGTDPEQGDERPPL